MSDLRILLDKAWEAGWKTRKLYEEEKVTYPQTIKDKHETLIAMHRDRECEQNK